MKTYNGFDLSQEDKRNLNAIIAGFDRYAIGETNEIFKRYLFNKWEQQEGESIDQYVAELRILAWSRNFCNCLHDSLSSDRIVLGIKDSGAHKRLLQQQQLTLQQHLQDKQRLKHTESLGQSVKEEVRRVKEKSKGVKKTGCGREGIKTERPEIATKEGAITT